MKGKNLFRDAVSVTKDVVHQLGADDCAGMAAEMAYNLMLASAPTLVCLVAVLGMIGQQQAVLDQVFYYAQRMIPTDALGVFRGLLETVLQGSTGGLALFGFLGALWAASNGAMVILKGLNRAYGYKKKNSFIRQHTVALLIVLSLGVTLLVASNLIVFGDVVLAFLERYMSLGSFHAQIVSVLRWLLVLLAMVGFSTYVYKRAPGPFDEALTWKRTLPGGITYTVLWIVISLGFGFYVENMGHYNQVYGALGAAIVAMLWMYLTSFAFLIGGELNAVLEARSHKESSGELTEQAKEKVQGSSRPSHA